MYTQNIISTITVSLM